jgi:sirohydrochlorin ferrochelatase
LELFKDMAEFDMPTLMIVSHGNSGNGGDPAGTLAEAVRDHWSGFVHHGYMRSQPSVADQLAKLKRNHDASELIVFPLFFSEGYLVFQELPRNLRDAGLDRAVILPPAINLPGFAEMVSRHVNSAMVRRGWDCSETSVFLVPHGLKTLTKALPETVRLANEVGQFCPDAEICIGNIEGNPSIRDWRKIGSRKRAVIVPMLAGGGTHATTDLPEMIAGQPDEAIEILDPIGEWAELPDLILKEAAKYVRTEMGRPNLRLSVNAKDGHAASSAAIV